MIDLSVSFLCIDIRDIDIAGFKLTTGDSIRLPASGRLLPIVNDNKRPVSVSAPSSALWVASVSFDANRVIRFAHPQSRSLGN